MAFDTEPTNNVLGTPDNLGVLSGGTGGSINFFLGQPGRTVQSATGSTLQGLPATSTVKDAVDHISAFIGTDVQSVRLKPGLIPPPNIGATGVVGGITHVEFRPLSGFVGQPVIIDIRVGYSRFKSLIEQTASSGQTLTNMMAPAILAGDPYVTADYNRLTAINNLYQQLAETNGVNVTAAKALEIAAKIRAKVAQGGSSAYASQVNTIGLTIASVAERWLEPEYTLDRGSGPIVVASTSLTSFLWQVTGGSMGTIAVSGYRAALSTATGGLRYNVSPLDISRAEIHIDTFSNGAKGLVGSAGDDQIEGDFFGRSVISGLGGNDRLYSGNNDDTLDGGAGNDLLWSGDGNDILRGGAGKDVVVIEGARRDFSVFYQSATDTFFVNFVPFGADDYTPRGVDTITGVEEISFYDQTVQIRYGTSGADALTGGSGDDFLFGLGGNDLLVGGDGNDRLDGGAGADTVSYASASAAVEVNLGSSGSPQNTYGAGSDTLIGIERLTGSAFADWLIGDAAANRLNGGGGDDLVEGGAGNDVLIGGSNQALGDVVAYMGASGSVTVSLAIQDGIAAQNTGAGGMDTLSGFENLMGSSFDDRLTGSSGANTLWGRAGADILNGGGGKDTLFGMSGNDILNGGAGHDILWGGTESDIFAFTAALSATANVDSIRDFEVGSDTIRLENSVFSRLSAPGTLDATFFAYGAAADGNDYIIYDNATGALYYDSNGSAAGQRVQFASLQPNLALDHTSFTVV